MCVKEDLFLLIQYLDITLRQFDGILRITRSKIKLRVYHGSVKTYYFTYSFRPFVRLSVHTWNRDIDKYGLFGFYNNIVMFRNR